METLTWEEAEARLPGAWCPSARELYDECKETGLFTPDECLELARGEANAFAHYEARRLRQGKEQEQR